MFRTLSTALLVLGLAGTAGALPAPAMAQSTRAYAPEDLRQLSVRERVRVLELEYAEQSGGRQLPDDQLEFYLAQINSGWNFSRIKQDIATSLRGQGNGNRPGGGWNGENWSGQTVICSSTDRRRRECRTPFQGRPELVENISGTRCVEGTNFGGGGGVMWVDQGCRGRFKEGRGGWNGGNTGNNGQTVRCESVRNGESTCGTPFRGRIVLARQLSSAACIEGQSWTQRGSNVTVRNGCRGDFAQAGNGGGWGGQQPGYSITCSSDDNRRRSCAWDRRQGRPVLIENISKTRCQEGYNWGWDGNAVWVDRGCRGRFGVR